MRVQLLFPEKKQYGRSQDKQEVRIDDMKEVKIQLEFV